MKRVALVLMLVSWVCYTDRECPADMRCLFGSGARPGLCVDNRIVQGGVTPGRAVVYKSSVLNE